MTRFSVIESYQLAPPVRTKAVSTPVGIERRHAVADPPYKTAGAEAAARDRPRLRGTHQLRLDI